MKKRIGIDLGGTTVKMAILSANGTIEDRWSIDTNSQDEGQYIVPEIVESLQKRLTSHGLSSSDVLGIGMGSPGKIDHKEGTVTGAYNLNWRSIQHVKKQIEGGIDIPFFIDNDANAAALGEQWKGAGENADNMVFVTLGTGVGGGIIVDGNIVRGASGAAGEIGHLTVKKGGYDCTCGNKGCLETVASATGIVRLAKALARDFPHSLQLKTSIEHQKDVTSKVVFDQAELGDPFALFIVDQVCAYLGTACASIANIVNPSIIVIGGGVSAAGEILLKGIEPYFHECTFPQVRKSVKIKIAELGNDAGIIGAAALVKNKIVSAY